MHAGGTGGEKASPEPGASKRGAGPGSTCLDGRGRQLARQVPREDSKVLRGGVVGREREKSRESRIKGKAPPSLPVRAQDEGH